ncbi:MAG: hypothetical protein JWO35_791 [Candidatus Saccharibacteria bacterium]|nr:hypothetical protein [Candidatus Saccharibacteria bacterium]
MRLMLRYKLVSAVFLVLSAVYLALTALTEPDKVALEKYHLTAAQAVALILTIALPYVIIWFIALIGYLRFNSYAETIRGSRDGTAFMTMSQGLLMLALWLPVSAVSSILAAHYYRDHPSSTATLIIAINYVNIALLFPAFIQMYRGARKLLPLIKTTAASLSQTVNLVFICFSALYVFLVLEDPARHAATDSTTIASYYLPDWLIIISLVIPRLIMWFFGAKAVQYLYLYRNRVKGTLYKAALNNLARGIAGVVLATIVLRCIQSLSSQLGELSLALMLLVIYLLLLLIAIGYVLIFKGAKNLQQIEEL